MASFKANNESMQLKKPSRTAPCGYRGVPEEPAFLSFRQLLTAPFVYILTVLPYQKFYQ
jgi:hypothetical protein